MASGNLDRAKSLFAQAQREFSDTECATEAEAALATIADMEEVATRINFDFDKYNIRDRDARILQAKAEVLKRHPDWTIIIQGNCDERGSIEYNLALGQRRAESVKRAMTLLGIEDYRIETVSFGAERPKAFGQDEASWSQNRRSDIVYPDQP